MIAKAGMAAKDTYLAVAVAPPDILHVGMVNAVAELAQELNVTDSLVTKVGRVVIKAEPAVIFDGLHRTTCRSDIERNFGRVHFERKVHIELVEHLQNRQESFAKVVKTF